MLGIPDFWISAAYVLCISSAVLCVIYGVVNWNKGGEKEEEQIAEESVWEITQEKVEDTL